MICLVCDEPLPQAGVIRLLIGAVDYNEDGIPFFVQEECDSFRDGTSTKWLCSGCAAEHQVLVDSSGDEECGAVDGLNVCGQAFEAASSPQSETVLRLEEGEFWDNRSNKGPRKKFEALSYAHIHFDCACTAWSLPLLGIPPDEAP
jgi:hypothetical protein